MEEENRTKDFFQATLSVWIVVLGLLYFSYPERFMNFFILSLLAWILSLALFLVVRKRKFGYIFKSMYERKILVKLKKMSVEEFEDFVANLFSKLGYISERVSGSEFGGIDILISGKDGDYYLVTKNHVSPDIGRREVEEFYEALLRHRASGKMVSVGGYSDRAKGFAREKAIELVGGSELLKLINRVGNNLEIK